MGRDMWLEHWFWSQTTSEFWTWDILLTLSVLLVFILKIVLLGPHLIGFFVRIKCVIHPKYLEGCLVHFTC